ncbi:MAG: phage shock protein PspA [Gammaproteobacteria bacterium]|nr:MAG: phage shock protein PspA [Gammaproteobacteria bacterium]
MGIFTRFADIVNSNLNSMLDKAEDPEKMLKLIIQEMEQTLVEVRSSSVKTIANKKELKRHMIEVARNITRWTEKAELAISKQRDDLARAALIEKQNLQDSFDAQENELVELESSLAKLNEDITQLQEKLTEAKSRRAAMQLRHKTATTRIKVKRQLNNKSIDDAFSKFEQYEQKMDRLEAEVESYDLGKGQSLSDQIDQLVVDEKIEEELESLKVKFKKAS